MYYIYMRETFCGKQHLLYPIKAKSVGWAISLAKDEKTEIKKK